MCLLGRQQCRSRGLGIRICLWKQRTVPTRRSGFIWYKGRLWQMVCSAQMFFQNEEVSFQPLRIQKMALPVLLTVTSAEKNCLTQCHALSRGGGGLYPVTFSEGVHRAGTSPSLDQLWTIAMSQMGLLRALHWVPPLFMHNPVSFCLLWVLLSLFL